METLLRKHIWAIDLAAVALCAVLAARATATLTCGALLRPGPAAERRTGAFVSGAAPAGGPPGKSVDQILRRNVFCSACPPFSIEPRGTPEAAVDRGLVRTKLPLRLLAIMYAPPPADPRWSAAIISEGVGNNGHPYLVGSRLRDATVDEIDELRIYLDFGGGRREYLELLEGTAAPRVAPGEPAAVADPLAAELDAGIRSTGAHSHEVQRATVDALLAKMGSVAPAARVVPEVRQGAAAGFRLLGVRVDGPFAKIGLATGDVITAVDGLPLANPENALAIYTKLRTTAHLSVSLERDGQAVTEAYDIR